MQELKNIIRFWAEEASRRACACRNTAPKGFSEPVRQIAERALECFLQLPDRQFDSRTRQGMFAERISLWKEMGSADFVKRKRPEACSGLPREFRCDVRELDVFQVLLYNGCVAGPRGKNLLFPDLEADLGTQACVCRLSDLTATPENEKKLQAFFEEAQQGLCQAEKAGKTRSTADFSRGGREAGLEQIKWLNRALSEDTLIIYLPAGCRLEKPLQIVSLCHSEEPSFVQTHCWVLLEENASLSLVQCTDSNPKSEVLANALTEIRLEENAQLEYIQLQNVGDRCKIFHNLNAQQQRASKLFSYNLTLNGGLTQNNLEVNLNRPEAHAELFGLYLQDREQSVSNHIKINHFAPNTYSRELFKGVLDDAASSFFKGHVFVSPEADQTEAYQTNRNLLISSKAQAHAKPYLEIYADDVQCNHGVTVGQLDEDALFYMRCRGIPTDMARRLLMRAYADEILKPISVDSLRAWMTSLVKRRFSGQLQACEECVLSCKTGECGN